jgi:hypothetical protein
MEFWSWGVWLESWLELVEFSSEPCQTSPKKQQLRRFAPNKREAIKKR